jgi:FAD/FMN-containing dehydrogenase
VSFSGRDFLAIAATSVGAFRRADPLIRFRQSLAGTIVLPGDVDYDGARAVASVNPRTDKRPRLIARCANADDVARTIEFGRTQSLEIAVRAGGHDLLGASTCDGGIVIDLSRMNVIHIDSARRLARIESGARSRDVNRATEPHGLVAALGCHPAVGVAGLTLGGGLGWFLGRFGAACDNLVGAHVVTADARRVRARADDLQLHPVGRVFGGLIAFRTDLGAFLRFHRDFLNAAPDGLVIETSIVVADQPVILCAVCWSGEPTTEGERVLEPLRAFGPPAADAIGSVSYAHLTDRPDAAFWARAFGSPPTGTPPSAPPFDYWKGGSLDELTDRAIEEIVGIMRTASRGMSMGLGHYIHGQIGRMSAGETPLLRTLGQLTYFFDANWRDGARAEAEMAWVDTSWQRMQPHSSRGTYVNYLSRDDDEAVRATYRSNMRRLVGVKRRYDPSNVFHLNRNIRP